MVYIEKNDVRQILSVEYGIPNNYINITQYVIENFINDNILKISKNINLNNLFGDPCVNVAKKVKIECLKGDTKVTIYEFEELCNFLKDEVIINLAQNYRHKDIYGVYYICCCGSYLDIVEEQLTKLVASKNENSSLYHLSKKVILFISLYDKNNNELNKLIKKYDVNNKFQMVTSVCNLYEKFAINNYKDYIDSKDYYLYYFHTKGVSRSMSSKENIIFHNTRKNLNFYTLTNYKTNLELLEKYDAVGCGLSKNPRLHFSGNFWWTKSSHIEKLINKISDKYLAPEMYICSYENGKYISLTNSCNSESLEENIILDDNTIKHNITENVIDISWFQSNFEIDYYKVL